MTMDAETERAREEKGKYVRNGEKEAGETEDERERIFPIKVPVSNSSSVCDGAEGRDMKTANEADERERSVCSKREKSQ